MRSTLIFAALALSACAHQTATSAADPKAPFMARLAALCAKAFAGRLVSNDEADAEMRGVAMVMHVSSCSPTQVRVPFHVQRKDGSWDRSRTWVLTRTAKGLRLKHDHRHEDGGSDTMTMYGGDTADVGTPTRQSFPADTESIALFRREGRDVSVTNIWAIEVDGARYAYELRRTVPAARLFRVEFDLTRPVAVPPPVWGSADQGR